MVFKSPNIMKIALISFEFYPSIGGVSRHLTSFCKAFHETDHQLYIFNQGYKGKNIFDILERKNYSFFTNSYGKPKRKN